MQRVCRKKFSREKKAACHLRLLNDWIRYGAWVRSEPRDGRAVKEPSNPSHKPSTFLGPTRARYTTLKGVHRWQSPVAAAKLAAKSAKRVAIAASDNACCPMPVARTIRPTYLGRRGAERSLLRAYAGSDRFQVISIKPTPKASAFSFYQTHFSPTLTRETGIDRGYHA